MVPLSPNRSRSLKFERSYTPYSSRVSVSVKAQISSSLCQSASFRARRETSSRCATTKSVLPFCTLHVLNYLPHRRLSDIQVGGAFDVMRLKLERLVRDDLASWGDIASVARS